MNHEICESQIVMKVGQIKIKLISKKFRLKLKFNETKIKKWLQDC